VDIRIVFGWQDSFRHHRDTHPVIRRALLLTERRSTAYKGCRKWDLSQPPSLPKIVAYRIQKALSLWFDIRFNSWPGTAFDCLDKTIAAFHGFFLLFQHDPPRRP